MVLQAGLLAQRDSFTPLLAVLISVSASVIFPLWPLQCLVQILWLKSSFSPPSGRSDQYGQLLGVPLLVTEVLQADLVAQK